MKKIGIATSVSALYNYDFNDTLDYFDQHSQFKSLQIYLDKEMVNNDTNIHQMLKRLALLENTPVYFHLEGKLNSYLLENLDYLQKLAAINDLFEHQGFILHFDHKLEIMEYRELLQEFKENINSPLLIEIYFKAQNQTDYQQQLNKYQSLFSLFHKQFDIRPVIDIPRFYHINNKTSIEQATHDIKLTLNLMKSKELPVLLHLIDINNSRQTRSDFCTIGEGIIPYDEIFEYINYNKIQIENIILEYEDKIKPLESIKYFEN